MEVCGICGVNEVACPKEAGPCEETTDALSTSVPPVSPLGNSLPIRQGGKLLVTRGDALGQRFAGALAGAINAADILVIPPRQVAA